MIKVRLLLAIIALIVISLAVQVYSGETTPTTIKEVPLDPIQGKDAAPVTITYYYDYQCRWCKRFELETMPKLKKLIDAGKVKINYKDYVFIGDDSIKAANVAECIFQEEGTDTFLEFHAKLYKAQKTKNTGWVTDKLLKNIMLDLNVSADKIFSCANSKKYESNIQLDTETGKLHGVTSTPTFIVGGKKISGAQPYEVFEKIILEG